MRLHLTKSTEVLTVAAPNSEETVETVSARTSTASPVSSNSLPGKPNVGILLMGKCLVVPQWLSLFDVIKELGTGSSLVEMIKSKDVGRKNTRTNIL
jgi:hypothetical protein